MTDTLERSAVGDVALPTPLPDHIQELTMGWLLSYASKATRAAYRVHLSQWLAFCSSAGIDPLTASRGQASLWARWLELPPREYKPATVAAKLAAVSSWYTYLLEEDALEAARFCAVDRPRLDRAHSETRSLDEGEARDLVAAADMDHGRCALRTAAMTRLMLALGPRAAEVSALKVADLGVERGFRTVRISGKGGKVRLRNLPPATAAAVDRYLEARAAAEGVAVDALAGPLFVTSGGLPVPRRYVFDLVQRLARDAGIEDPDSVTPHSLRHTFATLADERGAPIAHLQDALGHSSAETTRRYIHAKNRLEQDPSQIVAAVLG